jgi:hypothetical protein
VQPGPPVFGYLHDGSNLMPSGEILPVYRFLKQGFYDLFFLIFFAFFCHYFPTFLLLRNTEMFNNKEELLPEQVPE